MRSCSKTYEETLMNQFEDETLQKYKIKFTKKKIILFFEICVKHA